MIKNDSKTNMVWLLTGICALLISAQVMAADMPDTITVTSSAFDMHGTVPEENSAYGDNKSIDLSWSNLPAGTRQIALICDDPIGPMPQPFVHWVAYNIPAGASLPGGLTRDAEVSGVAGLEGMINGLNGIRQAGYFGPRPPIDGKLHAYHFRIFALDAELGLDVGLNKAQLLEAIDGHVLATGMLMGHYERKEN